jgi:hypothetical protein
LTILMPKSSSSRKRKLQPRKLWRGLIKCKRKCLEETKPWSRLSNKKRNWQSNKQSWKRKRGIKSVLSQTSQTREKNRPSLRKDSLQRKKN